MQYFGIIPARYGSTRFPGKPLADIGCKSMIRRVYEQALRCTKLQNVLVATDDSRIFEHVMAFGGNAVITHPEHTSGTDRCLEAAQKMETELRIKESDIIVNIQGDEPFIKESQIDLVCSQFQNSEVDIATLAKPISSWDEINNPNVVKVCFNNSSRALYFSRSAIPFLRDDKQAHLSDLYFKHIGMYAYRYNVLKEITKLAQSRLEKSEKLEQLRWLENGYDIFLALTQEEALSVDTPDDLMQIINELGSKF